LGAGPSYPIRDDREIWDASTNSLIGITPSPNLGLGDLWLCAISRYKIGLLLNFNSVVLKHGLRRFVL
jgi:hypothetical protein